MKLERETLASSEIPLAQVEELEVLLQKYGATVSGKPSQAKPKAKPKSRTKKSTVSMKAAWQRLENWLAANIPMALATMLAGASKSEIKDYEAKIGQKLLKDGKEWRMIHNGQDDDAESGVIFGLHPLSLAESLDEWTEWRYRESMNEENGGQSFPAGAIQIGYTFPSWIRLTRDGGANHLELDLNTDAKGTVGQVINFGRDETNARPLKAGLISSTGSLRNTRKTKPFSNLTTMETVLTGTNSRTRRAHHSTFTKFSLNCTETIEQHPADTA